MAPTDEIIWRVLDRSAEIDISYRQLPHWDQCGALTFVTFRLADSMPLSVIRRWEAEQLDWLQRKGIDDVDLKTALNTNILPDQVQRKLQMFRSR